jgi:MerR family copper efflux transcriptional regulator
MKGGVMQPGVQIGELAKLSGLPIDTIRFYERKGLLKSPLRSEGGFRLFSRQDVARLKFVRRAQALGFSLGEVRDLLILQDEDTDCSHVRNLLESKLEIVRHKIAEMRRLEGELKDALGKCNREVKKRPASHGKVCPVLEEIGPNGKRGR